MARGGVTFGRSTLGTEMVFGVLLAVLLIGWTALRHPTVLGDGGLGSVLVPILLLMPYGAAGMGVRLQPEGPARAALRRGAAFGLAVGALFVIHLPVEHFVPMPRRIDAASSLAVMGLAFALFGAAGFAAAARAGSLRLGILASVWAAMISIVMTCLMGFALVLAAMPRLAENLRPESLRRGHHDLEAFAVLSTLESATSHLIQAPVIALVFGSVGGLIGSILVRRDPDRPIA